MTDAFKVALVALDGNSVPHDVRQRFTDHRVQFVARECVGREALRETASDADVVWVFGSHECLSEANLALY